MKKSNFWRKWRKIDFLSPVFALIPLCLGGLESFSGTQVHFWWSKKWVLRVKSEKSNFRLFSLGKSTFWAQFTPLIFRDIIRHGYSGIPAVPGSLPYRYISRSQPSRDIPRYKQYRDPSGSQHSRRTQYPPVPTQYPLYWKIKRKIKNTKNMIFKTYMKMRKMPIKCPILGYRPLTPIF